MKECVFLIADIDESGIEAWHEFFNFGQINVADGIGNPARLFL